MVCSTPGFPVLHHLQELDQTHIHSAGDAIQPSCPLLSPSPPILNLSQHQSLFQWVGSLHQVAKVLELQLKHQFSSVQLSRSFVYDSLPPHGLQHTRLPCPSPTPRLYSNSCPLSRWCHPTILSSPLLLLPSIFPSIRAFLNESVLCIRWPKYWEFQLQHQSFQWIFRTDFL